MVTGVILVRGDEAGAIGVIRGGRRDEDRMLPSRCSTSNDSGSRGERCWTAIENVRP